MNLLPSAEASEAVAAAVPEGSGGYFVLTFVGLGAPHLEGYARGTIVGLTHEVGAARAHLVHAALENMAYQTRDILESIQRNTGLQVAERRVDGGAAANNLLLQFRAGILGIPTVRRVGVETAARRHISHRAGGWHVEESSGDLRPMARRSQRFSHDNGRAP